jgi:hypothetical protein
MNPGKRLQKPIKDGSEQLQKFSQRTTRPSARLRRFDNHPARIGRSI